MAVTAVFSHQPSQITLQSDLAVNRALNPGETHRFIVGAGTADLVRVHVKASGAEARFEIRDPAEQLLARYRIPATASTPEEREVGFLVQRAGRYVVEIRSAGTLAGSYTVIMRHRSAGDRARDLVAATPKSDAPSPRITRLERDITAGVKSVEEEFWREASTNGTPLVEGPAGENHVLVTFLWRQTFPTANVQFWWGGQDGSYYMRRVPGTSVWYTTLRLSDDSRFGYAISPNHRPEDAFWTLELDPLNRNRFPATEGLRATAAVSVFEMPRAPDMTWATASAARKGTLQDVQLASTTFTELPILATVYTPPGFRAGSTPYPLLVLFDGWEYVRGQIPAPAILDNLIAAGRIRPVVACFIRQPARRGHFRGNSPFLNALAAEVLPQLRSRFSISSSASDVIVGGFSAGAGAAARVAFDHPTVFGNVLSQSAALRQADASGRPNGIARMYEDAERRPIRIYQDVGLYEPNTDLNREWKAVLTAKGYDVVYRERGANHHPLHWAGTLPEALMVLLAPPQASTAKVE
jgi:enterochelin esterase family protein